MDQMVFEGVAEIIYKAAIDQRKKMKYPTGKMKQMVLMKKLLPLSIYQWIVRMILERGV